MLKIVTSSKLCLPLVNSLPWNFFHNCWLYSCQSKHLDEFEMLPTIPAPLLTSILNFFQLLILNLFVKLFLYLTQLVANYLYSYFGQQKLLYNVYATFNPKYLRDPFSFLLILKIQRSFSNTFLCQFRVLLYTKSSSCVTRILQKAPSLLFHWNIASS